MNRVVTLKNLKVACKNCSLNEICLPVGVDEAELVELDSIVGQKPPLKRGTHLFGIGDAFRSIYAVRSGSLKTYALSESGEEQVIGFHLPGELVGLDAIADDYHPLAAKALETTGVCEIPFQDLESLSARIPSLQSQLLRLMSKEIKEDEHNMQMLGQKSADERLAGFLVSFSNRFYRRGYSPTRFSLSMSRGDIGNYLGLALETVSRLFTRFQSEGLLAVNRKEIELLDLERLCKFSGARCHQQEHGTIAPLR